MGLSGFAIPVFLDTMHNSGQLLTSWARLYHYGHIYMPALCVATVGLYSYTALAKRAAGRKEWTQYALAAVTTIAMVPFTWIVMVPTNDSLFALRDSEVEATGSVDMGSLRGLIVKWAWMHVTRSLFPLVGAYLGFTNVLGELRA